VVAELLEELRIQAQQAVGPSIAPVPLIKLGGVDPLGLRQINFDLMDQVLPGLNNVARHIRPFVVVSWAWRRAAAIAQQSGKKRVDIDDLRDFVDRIEVIYVWSQLVKNPNADLPGRDVISPILKAGQYTFGGEAWKKRREVRENSTSLMAAINYGPALKSMGWLSPHPEEPKVMLPAEWAEPALAAFEKTIANYLGHPAFSAFGKVSVTEAEVTKWGKSWAIDRYTKAEQRIFGEALLGPKSPKLRQLGMGLVIAASRSSTDSDLIKVRKRMSGFPSRFRGSGEQLVAVMNWRRVQFRQLFRLCMEATLYWTILQLSDGASPTQKLVTKFLKQTASTAKFPTTAKWIEKHYDPETGPVELIESLENALQGEESNQLAIAIIRALAFCLKGDCEQGTVLERPDRLPLRRARAEFEQTLDVKPGDFVKHILESWIFAQHVYWSVGRGLADARARGKTILRLKVVLEDGGWALAPGVSRGSLPVPTADRLRTALSLAHECGLIEEVAI
jgi:hypothetical protein